jgi:dienelactone hydrolase
VTFYPDPAQSLKALGKITAPTLAIFAGEDPTTSAAVNQFEQAATASRRAHAVKVFPGVMRGFHDPGQPKIYKPDVAKEAWSLAIQHLDSHTKEKAPGSAA